MIKKITPHEIVYYMPNPYGYTFYCKKCGKNFACYKDSISTPCKRKSEDFNQGNSKCNDCP